jgi:NitT/TauT family transport system substrate-binding protein
MYMGAIAEGFYGAAPPGRSGETPMTQSKFTFPSVLVKHVTVVALAAATVTLANASAAQDLGLTTLRIANFTNANVLPLFYGMEKGYFKAAGLDVQIVKVSDGAASVAAVASGQADIGWSATAVPMFARANGVKIKIFMTAGQEGPPDHYGTFIDATGKSGITKFSQMNGKTVLINAFGTATELAIRERLMKAGVPWNDVKKVIVPFPQMPAALQLGDADAAVTIQPMQTLIMANKAIAAKVLDTGTLMESHKAPVTAACYFAMGGWLAEHRAAVLAFGRAYLRATKEVRASAELRTELLVKLVGMKPALASLMPDPTWFDELTVTEAAVRPNYEALVHVGMMKPTFPVRDVIDTLPY